MSTTKGPLVANIEGSSFEACKTGIKNYHAQVSFENTYKQTMSLSPDTFPPGPSNSHLFALK